MGKKFKNRNELYWVYILLCRNGAYYTGYTSDLERRYKEHLAGTAKCKYTRSFKPLKIAQAWPVSQAKIAKQLENRIKRLSRQEKEQLIDSPELISLS